MKRIFDMEPRSDYHPTSINTSTFSADENPPPSLRTVATRQRALTVRPDEGSSEESMDEEARSEEASQIRPGQRETHEKAGEPAQSRQPSSASLPRYREADERMATASLTPGVSDRSSTLKTSDVPQSRADPDGAYRLQVDDWVRSAHDMSMERRQEVKARIEAYLQSPENVAWTLDFSGFGLKTVPPLPRDLKKLTVSNNQLSALPEHLPDGLQELDVSENQLSALPERLPAGLQELYASVNRLNAFPEHLLALLCHVTQADAGLSGLRN
ncbi:MAG: sboJ [Burkholderia sp.]|nr:sboJ [Burkholderia sp.]